MGFYTDDDTGDLVVTVPSSRLDSFRLPAYRAAGGVRVQSLNLTQERVDAALRLLDSIAPELVMASDESLYYFFNPELGKIEAAGTIDASTMGTLLGDFRDLVHYRAGVAVVPASRQSMSAPFEGGGRATRVGSGNAFDCTTGFTVRKTSNGLRYVLTTGHCGPLGSSWISPGSGLTIGAMRYRQLGPQDVALIGDKTYAPVIYTGDVNGVESTVKGAADPVINRPIYCYSGGATFERCDVAVLSMSVSTCYSGGCFSNLMSFQQYGSCPGTSGDSGAPFYLDFDFGGFPYIRGTYNARVTDNSVCFGGYWSRISAALGVTIVTG